MTKTSSSVKNAWNKRNYDRITIVVKKGQKKNCKILHFKMVLQVLIHLLHTA